jgi:hypothetical protein
MLTVPLFYFDVREGHHLILDHEGVELDSLDDAEEEAVYAAAEIGQDRLPTGEAHEVAVEVRDESGQRVLAVTVSMKVYRDTPAGT